MRKRIFLKRIKKQNQKGESKKNKKRETIFQDTEKTWKINVKICPTKKRKETKPSILETEENRKREFCRSLQGFEICKESNRYRKTKRQPKNKKNLKGRKKVREPRKHGETTNRTCGQRMKKGGNEEVKKTL